MRYWLLLVLAALFLRVPSLAGPHDELAPQANNPLTIALSVDTSIVHPPAEMLFTESFKNVGTKPYTIYDDQCYYGDDLRFAPAADPKKILPTGSSPFGHTVKPGARPADVVLLQPGETFKRTFSAYITSDYRIFFQADKATIRMNKYRRLPNIGKEYEEVPQRFLGCGRVYALGQPGTYKVSARYDNDERWITRKSDANPVWTGHVTSPEITLKFAR